jgi:hypothetical protein
MATAATTNIDKVKALRAFAASLRGAVDRWSEKYADRKHYDKQGFGFTNWTDRGGNAFKVPTLAFEAYVGTYGSSSTGNAWRVDQALVDLYFAKALNQHKQAIFDSMAVLADAEAATLKDAASAEIESLRALLVDASAEPVPA